MVRNPGHCNSARTGFLRNMAAKHSKEMLIIIIIMAEVKQIKVDQVLAYQEQLPRSSQVLESFLAYSD